MELGCVSIVLTTLCWQKVLNKAGVFMYGWIVSAYSIMKVDEKTKIMLNGICWFYVFTSIGSEIYADIDKYAQIQSGELCMWFYG